MSCDTATPLYYLPKRNESIHSYKMCTTMLIKAVFVIVQKKFGFPPTGGWLN